MVIDLETERANGLDESQLAEQVMRLLVPGWQPDCNGPWRGWHDGASLCQSCDEIFDARESHKHTPKPLREVRDELITWLQSRQMSVAMEYRKDGTMAVGVRNCNGNVWANCWTSFDNVADTGRAIALAAVRLLGEKQDAKP